jgi:hypothetical protein
MSEVLPPRGAAGAGRLFRGPWGLPERFRRLHKKKGLES